MVERRPGRQARTLQVNPIACDGIGICAHLAPDLVRLDSWGFAILAGGPLAAEDERRAGLAVTGCPRRALFIASE
jgi:ferredoxin